MTDIGDSEYCHPEERMPSQLRGLMISKITLQCISYLCNIKHHTIFFAKSGTTHVIKMVEPK